jgi:hypothetical protein
MKAHSLKRSTSGNASLKWMMIGCSALVGGVSCAGQSNLHAASPKSQKLFEVNGATLDQISFENGNVAYLQTIDLHKMQLDQLMDNADLRKGAKGFYYPSKADDSSPFFKRLTVAAVSDKYQKQNGSRIFSIINASFFEDYQSVTRLSFPIKLNGKVMTAGSSPYGPIQKPADPYYRNIQLKVLTWDNEKATVSTYNSKNGYPLSQANIKNGLVSYAYQDHPSYALAGDPENRYHVFGVLNPDDANKTSRLLIATVNQATLESTATILRQRGVKGELMTIDGGISTYLWSIRSGDLILPQVAKGEKVAALPHYLGIRSKN